jgi:hypothetical protein
MSDYYYDDPIEYEPSSRRKVPGILASILILLAGGLFLNTTLAGNISINSGAAVEFGQGLSMTAACSGASVLTMTPSASFTNASGAGAFYFSSVTVSGIPSSCNGSDFSISAYNNTGSALPIFSSSSTVASIWSNAGTFQGGLGSSGTTITSGSGTFTVTFAAPVALASTVAKLTLQSGPHAALDCSSGGTCTYGNTGPGGGIIIYVNSGGFNCGPTVAATCRYLEMAPASWAAGDRLSPWAVAGKTSTSVNPANGITADATANGSVTGIGLGYINSLNIVAQGNDATAAAGAARSYNGGGKTDWFLPDLAELTQICKYISGQQGTPDSTKCAGIPSFTSVLGVSAASYWSSSEKDASNAWYLNMMDTYSQTYYTINNSKGNTYSVRPIRSF